MYRLNGSVLQKSDVSAQWISAPDFWKFQSQVLCFSQRAKLTMRRRKSAAKHTAPSRACPFQVLTPPSRGAGTGTPSHLPSSWLNTSILQDYDIAGPFLSPWENPAAAVGLLRHKLPRLLPSPTAAETPPNRPAALMAVMFQSHQNHARVAAAVNHLWKCLAMRSTLMIQRLSPALPPAPRVVVVNQTYRRRCPTSVDRTNDSRISVVRAHLATRAVTVKMPTFGNQDRLKEIRTTPAAVGARQIPAVTPAALIVSHFANVILIQSRLVS
jgi:hypothetical protein